jgi:hypothetical protein
MTNLSPLAPSYDVLICGGGPAGIGAAVAAARAGARTLLLERSAFLGGVGAVCLGMPINQIRPFEQPRGVIHEMLIERLLAYGPQAGNLVGHALVTNVAYLKAALLDLLDDAGVEYRLHSHIIAAHTQTAPDKRVAVRGVTVTTKQGLRDIQASVTVDCTGDADVAFLAGAETLKGRPEDGFLSPMTLELLITNVDVPAARAFQKEGGLKRLLEEARPTYPLLPHSMGFELGPHPLENALVINHAGTRLRGVLDGTSPEDMTIAEHYSHHQAIQIVDALRAFGGPAFARVQLAATGPQTSVRETRRVKGPYQLTEEDALAGTRFPDAIAWRSGLLDIGFVRYEPMKLHDVPFRSIIPVEVDQLLFAGRCISATHVAASAGKSMGNCIATGHAAGLAAALSVQQSIAPRALDVALLQSRLRADGVNLEQKG